METEPTFESTKLGVQPKVIEKEFIVSMDCVVKNQHVWGFREKDLSFQKLNPSHLLKHCPSCGAGPIKWSAIRNKRNNNRVSLLRCNRQAKGTCDYRGALRRSERKRLLRAAVTPAKHRMSRPIDEAFALLSESMQLLQIVDKPTLYIYLTSATLPVQIRQFMLSFLLDQDSPLDDGSVAAPIRAPIPDRNKFSFGAEYPAPPRTEMGYSTQQPPPLRSAMLTPQPCQRDLLLQQLQLHKEQRHQMRSSAWDLSTTSALGSPMGGKPNSGDMFSSFKSPGIGRFSSGMGLDGMMGSDTRFHIGSDMRSRMGSSMFSAPLTPFGSFGPSSVSTGANNRDSSSSLSFPHGAANALAQLADDVSRMSTLSRPSHRKRELNPRNSPSTSPLPKKACHDEFALDPAYTSPQIKAKPPVVLRAANAGSDPKGPTAVATDTTGKLAEDTTGIVMCPCCLTMGKMGKRLDGRYCLACGACLQWT